MCYMLHKLVYMANLSMLLWVADKEKSCQSHGDLEPRLFKVDIVQYLFDIIRTTECSIKSVYYNKKIATVRNIGSTLAVII
jgi:hypothetical protein